MNTKPISRIVCIMLCLISVAVCLTGCNPEGEEDTVLTYKDIYNNQPMPSDAIVGASVYKASYGYVGASAQGYNAYYYQMLQNNRYQDLSYSNGKWHDGDVNIDQANMTSSDDKSAVRKFVAPVGGQVRISSNIYAVGQSQHTVSIIHNQQIIYTQNVSDSIGVYQSNTITLEADDEIYFIVEGRGTAYWNPTVDYTLASEKELHHTAEGGYGDVHPYYDEATKKMYMFYLATDRDADYNYDPAKRQFASLLTTSGNMVHYQPTNLMLDQTNPPEQDLYFALGVIKDNDGKYRSSYGKGSYAGGSVSDDLITWGNGNQIMFDADGMMFYSHRAYFEQGVSSGRDPDLFYDADTGKTYMVVMNYYSESTHAGDKALALYVADAEGSYSTTATRLLSFTGMGDPECPQLKKIGERWYLFYSVYGTGTSGGVGNLRYRAGDIGVAPQSVDWQSKTEYSLDGGDLHAAQITQVGNMYYMYGWMGYQPHANVWGGTLNMAREVYVNADGTLSTRMDEYLTRLINKGIVSTFNTDNVVANGMTSQGNAMVANGADSSAKLKQSLDRNMLTAKINLPQNAPYAKYVINQGSLSYNVGVWRVGGKCYLSIHRAGTNALSDMYIEIRDGADMTEFNIKVVLDNGYIEAFVNDQYSLTAHTNILAGEYQLSIAAGASGVSFSNANIYKLADYNNIFD